MLSAAWSLACGFDATGGGAGAQDTGAVETDDGASEATSGSLDTTGRTTVATETVDPDDGTMATTVTTTDDPSSTGQPEEPDVLAGDDAVVVRYYLDEQAAGAPRGDAIDVGASPPLDLSIEVRQSAPQYVEHSGNRGLHWGQHGAGGFAYAPVADTKFMDVDGLTEATIEVVVEVTSAFPDVEPWARILVWQPDIVPYNVQMGLLASLHEDAWALDVRSAWQVNNDPPTGRWSIASFPGRIVVQVVLDTMRSEEDRVRLHVDGQPADPVFVNPPDEGAPLLVSDSAFLSLGNRLAGDTAFGGTLYYAAIYARALDADELANNAAILLVDDDTPPRDRGNGR